MAWNNVGRIKGDTGDTGSEGAGVNVYKDSAHEEIIFVGDETETTIYFSDIRGATGPKGDTGDTGPVNLVSTLDTGDTTNAVTNSAIATAIEDVSTQIGSITAAQTANLNLLGS